MALYKFEKFIPTEENWIPNYPDNMVRVSIALINFKTKQYRVCIWGNDDFGMEYDSFDYDKCLKLYNSFDHAPTFKELHELGFVNA